MLSLLLATLSVGAPVNQTGGLGVINGRVTTAGNSHAEWKLYIYFGNEELANNTWLDNSVLLQVASGSMQGAKRMLHSRT